MKGLYIIAAGAFEVVRTKPEGEMRLARLEELSHFGDMALVADQPHGADVVCVEAGRLKRLSVEKFKELLANDDLSAYKVVRNMAQVMANRLQKLGEAMIDGC
jgi:CRP-like cAMP-binding protein